MTILDHLHVFLGKRPKTYLAIATLLTLGANAVRFALYDTPTMRSNLVAMAVFFAVYVHVLFAYVAQDPRTSRSLVAGTLFGALTALTSAASHDTHAALTGAFFGAVFTAICLVFTSYDDGDLFKNLADPTRHEQQRP